MSMDMDRKIPRSKWRSRPVVLGAAAIVALGVIAWLAAGVFGATQRSVRVAAAAVTIDTVGDESTYHFGVQVGTLLAASPKIQDTTVELIIKSASPAFGIAKALDQRMQGVTFIGFLHRFASPDGTEVELHWHLSADTAEVVSAVKEAVALREIQGQ